MSISNTQNNYHATTQSNGKTTVAMMHYCYMDSPVGRLLLAGDFNGLSLISFMDGPDCKLPEQSWRKDAAFFVQAILQLKEYFKGERQRFSLRLNPKGTVFQLDVLEALQRIPYGATVSYADIARAIGKPKAVRAVGSANRANPLPIIIPCHRVIGRNGHLTGFAGGLDIKQKLLSLEAADEFSLTP